MQPSIKPDRFSALWCAPGFLCRFLECHRKFGGTLVTICFRINITFGLPSNTHIRVSEPVREVLDSKESLVILYEAPSRIKEVPHVDG